MRILVLMITHRNRAKEVLECAQRSWWDSRGSRRWWCSSRCPARTRSSSLRNQHPGIHLKVDWLKIVWAGRLDCVWLWLRTTFSMILELLLMAMMLKVMMLKATCSMGTIWPTMVRPPVPRYWPAATSCSLSWSLGDYWIMVTNNRNGKRIDVPNM